MVVLFVLWLLCFARYCVLQGMWLFGVVLGPLGPSHIENGSHWNKSGVFGVEPRRGSEASEWLPPGGGWQAPGGGAVAAAPAGHGGCGPLFFVLTVGGFLVMLVYGC